MKPRLLDGIEFKRQMEEAETMLIEVALILAEYYKTLITNGIPEDLAKNLVSMQQAYIMGGMGSKK